MLEENECNSLAMYQLPNTHKQQYLIGKVSETTLSNALAGERGFAFTPATNSTLHAPYFISATKTGYLSELENVSFEGFNWPKSSIEPVITSHHDYLNQALGMIWAMNDMQLKKAILSRILKHPTTQFNPYNTFVKLCEKYPGVMVYLIAIPNVGTWVGATPETLVKIQNGRASTMALAGTQNDIKGTPLADILWGEKEQEEQEIVAHNIERLIKSHFPAGNLQVDGPHTVSTGALLHLNTNFEWSIDTSPISHFIRDLHPTPAIVGEPRDEALKLIADSENHDRAYYTGLLGPVGINGLTHIFVNLRCMQVFNNYVALYIGGGLTAESEPEAEWQETELKAKTLLSVL